MAKSLHELERERKQEAREAERWLRKHGIGETPGKRSDTGESAGRQTQHPEKSTGTYSSNADGVEAWERMLHGGADGRTPNDTTFEDVAAGEQHHRHDRPSIRSFEPLIGNLPGITRPAHELSEDEQERRARLEHVMDFLLPEHRDLLRMRHVERLTLETIAEEWACSHQNIVKRLAVAEQDFRREYALHYEDPLDA